jgi:hypothetical protein
MITVLLIPVTKINTTLRRYLIYYIQKSYRLYRIGLIKNGIIQSNIFIFLNFLKNNCTTVKCDDKGASLENMLIRVIMHIMK